MKPVNFIEIKKDKKDIKTLVLLLLPLCLLVGFIAFDIFTNFSDTKNKSSELISLKEANILETKIQSLKEENQEIDSKINFYNELEIEKSKDNDLIKSLEIFSANTSNNIFINSFSSSNQDINITGISLSSNLLDQFDQEIKKELDSYLLNEVNFEDGYYKFSYRGEVKWNLLWI